ncbi:putative zinc-binding metallopeptidase [Halomonas sabkhae]|uniref:zinc-binding metallopeptidase family protein n=1 Tax=Halomonas sabkhae TaxID=626223 RepID=UPI0025B3334E|nr:putative zinc-binding metallopeptidase [Halomonas sabkhae]MDN3524929.1 putative zinc-binding metallopeptidase [Halomonas sabkhae]
MRTFDCHCCQPASRLFYDNTRCLGCDSEVGWCPVCCSITALRQDDNDCYHCTTPGCGAALVKCDNYALHGICNRLLTPDQYAFYGGLCDCCRHNRVIPDLHVEGHRERWAALERAKRRLVYTLDLMGLPHPSPRDDAALPLTFAFMADATPENSFAHATGNEQKVYTGHHEGHITINLMEADDVERERLRVDLNEPHRTLIGHFRHEIGHYYWELLVKGQDEAACRAVFGDHDAVGYGQALERYYEQGPALDWWENHVSAYATMHPWEDFAETWALYLNMVSLLDTADNSGLRHSPQDGGIDAMILAFQQIGLAINELNREMGLLDAVPAVITPAIRDKLAYIHGRVTDASRLPG